jgi:hypothetical protein
MFNISKDPNRPTLDYAYTFDLQVDANAAAINEARLDGDTWYVLEVTHRPVFKAASVTQVTTEVM